MGCSERLVDLFNGWRHLGAVEDNIAAKKCIGIFFDDRDADAKIYRDSSRLPVFELEARHVVNFYGFQSLVDGIKYQLDSIQG